jgi:hypothetical protein
MSVMSIICAGEEGDGVIYLPLFEQGGLIGLAAATMGLGAEAAQHLEVNYSSLFRYHVIG